MEAELGNGSIVGPSGRGADRCDHWLHEANDGLGIPHRIPLVIVAMPRWDCVDEWRMGVEVLGMIVLLLVAGHLG